MNKKSIIAYIVVPAIIILLLLGYIYKGTQQLKLDNRALLFYSQRCFHCMKVEDFIKQFNVKKYLSFEQIELDKSRENISLIVAVSKKCGIDSKTISIPLYWTGSKCLTGDQAIIKYFKQELAR